MLSQVFYTGQRCALQSRDVSVFSPWKMVSRTFSLLNVTYLLFPIWDGRACRFFSVFCTGLRWILTYTCLFILFPVCSCEVVNHCNHVYRWSWASAFRRIGNGWCVCSHPPPPFPCLTSTPSSTSRAESSPPPPPPPPLPVGQSKPRYASRYSACDGEMLTYH